MIKKNLKVNFHKNQFLQMLPQRNLQAIYNIDISYKNFKLNGFFEKVPNPKQALFQKKIEKRDWRI